MFSRYRVSVLQDEKVLEIYRTIMGIYLTQLAAHLKMVKVVNLMSWFFFPLWNIKKWGRNKDISQTWSVWDLAICQDVNNMGLTFKIYVERRTRRNSKVHPDSMERESPGKRCISVPQAGAPLESYCVLTLCHFPLSLQYSASAWPHVAGFILHLKFRHDWLQIS